MRTSEAGHWYAKDGTPAYTLIGKNGKERNTTLRDARKLGLAPSVTAIIKQLAAPQLERWKQNQIMMAALTLPPIEGESLKDFESRVWADSNEQSIVARDRGTEIHGYIESHFKDSSTDTSEAKPYIEAVEKALYVGFGKQKWNAEKSFCSPLGFGGKIDLHSLDAIVDYKTKDLIKMDMKKSMTYDENILQLSAYRRGLNNPQAKIANLYIGRELQDDGTALVKLEIHDSDYWDRFECLLKFWQLTKGYSPDMVEME